MLLRVNTKAPEMYWSKKEGVAFAPHQGSHPSVSAVETVWTVLCCAVKQTHLLSSTAASFSNQL